MTSSNYTQIAMERFSNMMIERMQQMIKGTWEMGWLGNTYGSPINIEGKEYQGSNAFFLKLYASMESYEYPVYCTINQLNKHGAHVLKGSKSVPVFYWEQRACSPKGETISIEDFHGLPSDDKPNYSMYSIVRVYNVFNVAQTNLKEVNPKIYEQVCMPLSFVASKDTSGMYSNDIIDRMIDEQRWLCPIHSDKPSDSAFYSIEDNKIVIPMKSQFRKHKKPHDIYIDGQEFYTTLIHEMIHSTGISTHLNRKIKNAKGSREYANEELIAELGAARVCHTLGFSPKILDNNAAYLNAWIDTMRENPRYIINVIHDVEKASRMVLEKLGL